MPGQRPLALVVWGQGEERADGVLWKSNESLVWRTIEALTCLEAGRQTLRMFSKNPAYSRVTKGLSPPNLIWLFFQPCGTFWAEAVVPILQMRRWRALGGERGGEPALAMVSRIETPPPPPGCPPSQVPLLLCGQRLLWQHLGRRMHWLAHHCGPLGRR